MALYWTNKRLALMKDHFASGKSIHQVSKAMNETTQALYAALRMEPMMETPFFDCCICGQKEVLPDFPTRDEAQLFGNRLLRFKHGKKVTCSYTCLRKATARPRTNTRQFTDDERHFILTGKHR